MPIQPYSPYSRNTTTQLTQDQVFCQLFTRQEDECCFGDLPIKMENVQQPAATSTILVDHETKKRYKQLSMQTETGCYHCTVGHELRLRIRNKSAKPFSFCLLFQDTQGIVTSIFPLLSVHLSRQSFVRLLPGQELVLSIPTDTLPLGCTLQQALVSLMLVATACQDVKQVVNALRSQGTRSSQSEILTLHHYPFIMTVPQNVQENTNVQPMVAVW